MFGADYYTVEDFLLDDTFADWAAGGNTYESFWMHYMEEFPGKAEVIQQAIEVIRAFRLKEVQQPSATDINEIIEKVKHRISVRNSERPVTPISRFKRQWQSFAAVILILLLTASYFYHTRYAARQNVEQLTSNGYRTIINHSTKKILAQLADHSSVILSPNARLRYPVTFSAKRREAWLSGEAFFEITGNPAQPFFVYTDELKIRVIGTSFFVKANREDKTYQVAVSTGRVSVYAKNSSGKAADSQHVMLNPNQTVLFNDNDSGLEKAALKHPLLLSHVATQRNFRFEEAPFSQVVAALEKAYGIKIIYNEKDMNACLLTASLTEGKLDERLSLICKAVEADYRLEDGFIIINGKGCN
jgi:transmembrane sensor